LVDGRDQPPPGPNGAGKTTTVESGRATSSSSLD
jgi:hypothetical protein